MRLEAKVAGFGAEGNLGEQGLTQGQRLVANIMHVLRTSANGTPLLVKWENPPRIVRHLRKKKENTAWGYSWRLMAGGRHEWSVGSVSRLPGGVEDMIEVPLCRCA